MCLVLLMKYLIQFAQQLVGNNYDLILQIKKLRLSEVQ